MAAYSHFLGSWVNVQYRFGDILLSASGTFVADSGRSIFLEQHLEQRGKRNYFRWEIPYPYIHRIEAGAAPDAEESGRSAVPASPLTQKAASAAAGESSAGGASLLSFPRRPKTA